MRPSNHPPVTGIVLPVICVLGLSLISCVKIGTDRFSVPETPLFVSESTWVLAREAYVRLKESPDAASVDRGFLKRGEIFPVEARVFKKTDADPEGEFWYQVSGGSGGWVIGTDIDTFDSREKAVSALGEK